jgi:hypothetical protein
MSAAPPTRAADFIGAIGVNIHPTQAGYGVADIASDMAYLGLDSVRTQAIGPNTPKSVTAAYAKLADAGLTFDFITGGAVAPTLAALKAFEKAHPGAVASIEGPNEVNNFPFSYKGLTGTAAAVAYMKALYAAARASPALSAIPILDFTDNPPTAGAATASNQQPYPVGGDQPLATVTAEFNASKALMPGKPVYFSEAGYYTLPGQLQWEGVDDLTQAKLTLNLVMDAASLGVAATYLYDLVDDGPDPTNTIQADHFGLFNFSGSAKPAAVAIHDLTTILADPGAAARTFTPTALNITLSGLPADGQSLVLEKSSGVYDIVVWAEPTIWNTALNQPITVAATPVTVTLTGGTADLTVYDPLRSAAALTSRVGASVTVALTDHPLIIQVSRFAAAAAAFGAAGSSVIAAPFAPSRLLLAAPHASAA